MHKKLGIILVAVALIGGLFAAFGATPAWAVDPPASFLPDSGDDGGDATSDTDESRSDVLSDRFDGVNSTAHLTLVGSSNTDTAHWFHCPSGTDEGSGADDFIEQAELTQCTQMGTDTTAKSPVSGTTFTPADKAYGLEFNNTTSLDSQTLDVLGLTCVGSAIDVEGSGQNCSQTLEEEVFFDDAETGEPDHTAGEIFQICTADFGGPDSGGEPCDATGTTQGSSGRATIDARFKNFEHGDPVPNDGFTFRARTSPDITGPGGELDAHVDEGADANTQPQVSDIDENCVTIETFSTFTTWQCEITASELDDNIEFALWIENETAGTGSNCDAGTGETEDCTLDSHYHASSERAATTAVKSLDPEETGPPDVPDVAQDAGCEPGETADKDYTVKDSTDAGSSPLNETVDEEGCFYDQFNDLFSGVYTVESSGVGGLVDICSDTTHDHNADGIVDHLHGDATDFSCGDTGELQWEANNPNAVPGDQTVTFCFEGEPQTGATPPANHGCADETVKDSNVIHWGTVATEVFLAYSGTATDPNDPCRTGQTFKINRVGDTETLVVCTFDGAGNKVSTQPEGSAGGRLTWVIETTVGGELTGVRFVGLPPDETPDPNGEITLQIEAFRESSNFVCVTLRDADGDFIDEFCIEKRIERRGGGGGGGGGRDCDIVGTRGNDRIRGTRRGETICAKRGNDRVRARGGGDNVKGQKGRDRLRGQKGRDTILGGKGRDVLIGGKGFDRCLGGRGRDRFRGCERRIQ